MARLGNKFISLLLLFLFLFSSTGWCKDPYVFRAAKKLGRGLYNIVYSPLELPRAVETGLVETRIDKMILLDPIRGIFNTVGRFSVGAYEVVSFLYPQPPIIHPVYLMEGTRDYLTYQRKVDSDGP